MKTLIRKCLLPIVLWSSVAGATDLSVFEGTYHSSGAGRDPKSATCPSPAQIEIKENAWGVRFLVISSKNQGTLITSIPTNLIQIPSDYARNQQGIITLYDYSTMFKGELLLARVPNGSGGVKNHVELTFTKQLNYDRAAGRNWHLNCTYTIFSPSY